MERDGPARAPHRRARIYPTAASFQRAGLAELPLATVAALPDADVAVSEIDVEVELREDVVFDNFFSWGYPKDGVTVPIVGRREAKKAQMRERIADAAAELFAVRSYDDVSVLDVARSADVSEQTVYNYFPAKQDLVLDRADAIRAAFSAAVAKRAPDVTPAAAVRPFVHEVIDLVDMEDLAAARGQFAAQAVVSPSLRRFALEFRERQARSIADAIRTTDPDVPVLVAFAHASALVSVVQSVTDAVGGQVIAAASGTPDTRASARIRRDADAALDDLDRAFRTVATQRSSR